MIKEEEEEIDEGGATLHTLLLTLFMFNLNEAPSRTPVWLPCSGYVHVRPG